MPNWKTLLEEVKASGSTYDIIRRRCLKDLSDTTGRNVIAYYSGWLQKADIVGPNFSGFSVSDGDKNGFMAVIHGMDRALGLDLILHTPGGDLAATESLVDYLRSMFGTNIRAIVPQLSMSAGTMMALACKEVLLGKHSSLGPIDPQTMGIPAHGVIEEFEQAKREVAADPGSVPLWQVIFSKYHPTFIGECDKAIKWSKTIVKDWLISGMFHGDADADAKATRVVEELADHAVTLSHARHYSLQRIQDLGVRVVPIENDQNLQDKILTVHHSCILTLSATATYKLIENQAGVSFIQVLSPAFQGS
jgi:hypothetical protein